MELLLTEQPGGGNGLQRSTKYKEEIHRETFPT